MRSPASLSAVASIAAVLAASAGASAATSSAPPGVAAAPMTAPGPNPTYPRLTAFPDAQVRAKVNALLAAQEKTDRASRRECRAERSSGGDAHGSWETATAVSYLSPRFLSVQVSSSYDCGAAYPNDGIQTPVTYDLAAGAAVDWAKLFKPRFLSDALPRLYRARYPKDADKECRDVLSPDGGFGTTMILWLDRKRGLVVQPDFPHAVQACAEQVALSPAALAPYVRDPAVLADLKATVARR